MGADLGGFDGDWVGLLGLTSPPRPPSSLNLRHMGGGWSQTLYRGPVSSLVGAHPVVLWDGLPPGRLILRHTGRWVVWRGAYREEGRTGRGPGRAGPERNEFRSESARGLDPFSARQFPALSV